MIKKIFAISTLLLVLLVGAIFVYNFIFKEKPPEKKEGEKVATEGKKAIDPEPNPKISKNVSIAAISEESAFGPTLSPDGNSIFLFSGENGQLNQIDFSGKLEKVVSTEIFKDIKKVSWNKARNKVILEIADQAEKNSKFLYFDLAGKSIITLKENIDTVVWTNLGDKIIYKYYVPKTKKRTISVSDPDGKNWRDLTDFNYYGVKIAPVPGSPEISFWPSPSAFSKTSLNLISFSGENQKEILGDKFGVDILWSPNGKQALVSYTDQNGGHKTDLAIMNAQGGQFQSLGFPSFASKCAWSADSKSLYCALPGNVPEYTVLPNDWQEGKIQTTDTFWKIDIESGKKDRLVDPENISKSCDVLNPFLSSDKKKLFFVNKTDGKLYKLPIQE